MKYKPHKKPVVNAYADIKLPEPRISKFAVFLIRLLVRPYLFLFIGTAKLILRGDSHLFEAFRRVLAGESRCIIAFRHPYGAEPQILSWFFLFKLKALAKKNGVYFSKRPHALFVYGYEVVRWGGWTSRFFMPRVGAMPIHHAKMDSQGMTRIYRAIENGPYPVALAPEGQVSYSADTVPRLEPGVVRMGFGSAARLSEKKTEVPLEILPVSIHFRYGSNAHKAMCRLLGKIEALCGMPRQKKMPFTERLKICRNHILEVNEKLYEIPPDASLAFEKRLEKVIARALKTAERFLGVDGGETTLGEDFFFRIYRLRQLCWDRIFLPGLHSFEEMSDLERNVKDLNAGEAWYAGRHQELIDFCWYFCIPLPDDNTPLHRKVEYVQNLWDFANRTMGGTIADRKNIFPRRIIIQAAPPINITERLGAYHKDKKAATAEAMKDLEKAFLDCIYKTEKTE